MEKIYTRIYTFTHSQAANQAAVIPSIFVFNPISRLFQVLFQSILLIGSFSAEKILYKLNRALFSRPTLLKMLAIFNTTTRNPMPPVQPVPCRAGLG